MTKTKNKLNFEAKADRLLAWRRGNSFRYVVCKVKTPKVDSSEEEKRRLNIALVIDASGSMQGYPLQAAKDTALAMVERLEDGDVLSIVSFAEDSIAHLRGQVINEEGRRRAENAIMSLKTRGMTDLAGGWFLGAREASSAMELHPEHVNQVILLSDGHANRGILEPDILATHAAEMRGRGVSTSTVGIGEDYSITQLQALAESGGGRMHDAQFSHEIAEVVLAELGEARAIFAEDIRVILDGPDSAAVDILESYPLRTDGTKAEAVLGSLPSAAERTVVWRLKMPQGRKGTKVPITAHCEWMLADSENSQKAKPVILEFELAGSQDNNNQPRDLEASLTVARRWHSGILYEAMNLNRSENFMGAMDYVQSQLAYFKQYCKGIPETSRLVGELEQAARRVNYEMNERNRKEVQLWSKKMHHSEKDHRVAERMSYSQHLKL